MALAEMAPLLSKARMMRTALRWLCTSAVEIWLPTALLAAWWFSSRDSTSPYFPPLRDILESFRLNWLSSDGAHNLLPSLTVLVAGYGGAVIIGVALGAVLGLSRTAERATRPLLELVRAVPKVALFPVLIVLIGIGIDMKVVLVASSAVWPILLNTTDAVRRTEPLLIDMAASYGMSGWRRLRSIILPAAAPQIFAGARTALATSVILMVVSETVGSQGGIGYFLLAAQRSFRIADMWGTILAIGVLGYLLSLLFRLIEEMVLRWHSLYQARLDDPASTTDFEVSGS
jgi:ABC-type nitrate/sulfonate/bicarbonate transport system permease component